jgi:hypothetical protein
MAQWIKKEKEKEKVEVKVNEITMVLGTYICCESSVLVKKSTQINILRTRKV